MSGRRIFLLLLFLGLSWLQEATGRRLTVEDVTRKQLEADIEDEDYLAVFWCKFSAKKYFSGLLRDNINQTVKIKKAKFN